MADPDLDQSDPVRSRRISRTGQQVGAGSAAALVLVWVSSLLPWDFDPTDPTSKSIPPPVAVAIVLLVTMAVAWWMNRGRRAPQEAPRAPQDPPG